MAHVLFVGRSEVVPLDAIPIFVLDDPDETGVLGYHKQDNAGTPTGRAFVRPIVMHEGGVLSGDMSVAAIVSHEIVETFIDPSCRLWSDRGDGTLVAVEPCDPVHGQSYTINVDGMHVSVCNFVLPAWFDPNERNVDTKYDWMGRLHAPFQSSWTGYMGTLKGGVITETGTKQDPARVRYRTSTRLLRHPL